MNLSHWRVLFLQRELSVLVSAIEQCHWCYTWSHWALHVGHIVTISWLLSIGWMPGTLSTVYPAIKPNIDFQSAYNVHVRVWINFQLSRSQLVIADGTLVFVNWYNFDFWLMTLWFGSSVSSKLFDLQINWKLHCDQHARISTTRYF